MSGVTGHAHGRGVCEVVREVGAGQDGHDAGLRGRRGRVDRPDARVREGAADELGVQRTGDPQVVDVAGGPGEDRGVLPAEEPRPHDRGHPRTPIGWPAAARTDLTMLW